MAQVPFEVAVEALRPLIELAAEHPRDFAEEYTESGFLGDWSEPSTAMLNLLEAAGAELSPAGMAQLAGRAAFDDWSRAERIFRRSLAKASLQDLPAVSLEYGRCVAQRVIDEQDEATLGVA